MACCDACEKGDPCKGGACDLKKSRTVDGDLLKHFDAFSAHPAVALNFKSKSRKLSRRMKIQGMDISIETDKGEYRHWYDPHNKTDGKTLMKYPYGYIRRTEGADGEHIDVYVGPNHDEEKVYIVHQNKVPRSHTSCLCS